MCFNRQGLTYRESRNGSQESYLSVTSWLIHTLIHDMKAHDTTLIGAMRLHPDIFIEYYPALSRPVSAKPHLPVYVSLDLSGGS